jgi:hypothetical protein
MLAISDPLSNAALLWPQMDLFYIFPAIVMAGLFIAFANRNGA